MANNLRFISNIINRLKRNFGQKVVFKKPLTNEYDVETGAVTRTYETITIRKVVVMPVTTIEFFTYTLAYIVANKNFTYGANYDRIRRDMIVDAKDLKGRTLEKTWKCVFNGDEYDIEELVLAEDNRAYKIRCLRTNLNQD